MAVAPPNAGQYEQLPPLETKAQATPSPVQPADATVGTVKKAPSLRVSVATDKAIYRDGEKVKIVGHIFNIQGDPVKGLVDLRIAVAPKPGMKADLDSPIYRNLLAVDMGEFVVEDYKIQMPTPADSIHDQRIELTIAARAEPIGGGIGDLAFTSFSAEEVGWIRVGKILAPPAVFFLGLTIAALAFTMGRPTQWGVKWALIALYCASLLFLLAALAGPILVSFSPGTEALFRTTPVGIVKVISGTGGEHQWVLNVGGVVDIDGKIGGGFTVPLYILILSLIGAVISMFLKLPDFLTQYRAIPGDIEEGIKPSSALGTEAFKYFTYIVTGPFLGMIVYSLASLVEATNMYVMGIVAFSVGFISDGIVEAMVSFSEGILERATKPRTPAAGPEASGDEPSTAANPTPSGPPAAVPSDSAK